ncbi:MAG: metal ABC transporter permease, partial [Tissierellia bacterium]|nr:metal ABC transporter permease [Tissierellia bacterium]
MFNTQILSSYAFIVVSIGTFIMAFTAGAVGCITVLKGQSLIGDAIGHASFPGIVLSFMLFMQRDPAILMLGAIIAGATAFSLIQLIKEHSKVELDAVLAIVLSSFFGLGMVLKSYIQGNPRFAGASQSGLQNYIFGQAAYIMKSDIRLILAVAIPSILILFIFYKEIKVFVFDEVYSQTIGINSLAMNFIIILMTMSLIATGLKIVGAILISSLLIVPAITAMQWSNRFDRVLIIAAFIGGISAVLGTYVSTAVKGMSTGPTIILFMSSFALFSLIFGPNGMIAKYRIRK